MLGKKKTSIKDMLLKASVNSRISCVKIFEIMQEYSVSADELIAALDNAKIKINACQMGLFGCKGGKNIPHLDAVTEVLKDRISSGLDNGKLPCNKAWEIADELNIKKIDVSSACEALGIKISKCQLKAF
jgi:hypothetical protein